MKPIETLMHEHRLIEKGLDRLLAFLRGSPAELVQRRLQLTECLRFFKEFADQCHHAKEEDQLFPMLEERGFSPTCGPTAVMRLEHQQGRELIRRMQDALAHLETDQSQVSRFREAAYEYVNLLREHIQKEDHCLFPMAEQALDQAALEALSKRFSAVEQPALHERWESWIAHEATQTTP